MKRLCFVVFWFLTLVFASMVKAQDSSGVRLLGRAYGYWAGAHNIALQDNYAYIAAGVSGLQIVSVEDLDNPEPIGGITTYTESFNITVDGDLACLACNDTSDILKMIDVSDPTSPEIIGVIDSVQGWFEDDWWSREIILNDGYLYVLTFSGISVYDVSEPAEPEPRGQYNLEWLEAMDLEGDYLYVIHRPVHGADFMRVLDISNPDTLPEIGQLEMELHRDIEVVGEYAYVKYYRGFTVVNVSNPENPKVVTRFETGQNTESLFAEGNWVLVTNQTSRTLRVIDVSDPTDPVERGSIGNFRNYWGGIAVVENAAFSAESKGLGVGTNLYIEREGWLETIDLSDPDNPEIVSSYPPVGHVVDVALSGDYAYIAGREAGLGVVDVSDPSRPVETGHSDVPVSVNNLALYDNYALLAAGNDGLIVMDVSEPEDPVEVAHNDTIRIYDVVVNGNFAYTIGMERYRRDDFHVFDLSNLEDLTPVASTRIGLSHGSIVISGRYAYIAFGDPNDWSLEWGYLLIFDISEPDQLNLIGELSPGHYLNDVCVNGDYAFVAYHEDYEIYGFEEEGVMMVDVSDPREMEIVTYYQTAGSVESVEILGDRLFITDGIEGLRVVDVSDPQHLHEVGYYITPGLAADLTIAGQHAYVADWTNFGIYDCSKVMQAPTDSDSQPGQFILFTPCPNPFNSSITINFDLPYMSQIILSIHDLYGREVAVLANSSFNAGRHNIKWNAVNVPSGLYIARLSNPYISRSVKLTLIR